MLLAYTKVLQQIDKQKVTSNKAKNKDPQSICSVLYNLKGTRSVKER